MTAIIDIDIFADIICPWCYIGKKRLEVAFAMRPHITPRYRWRTFLLNPTMPQQGMDRQAYLHAKFGPAASAVYARISKAGSESGIDFNFMDIEKTPDTRPIHKLLIAAGQQAEPLSELFYHAYFLDGLDISSQDVQEVLIAKAGLDAPSCMQKMMPQKSALPMIWMKAGWWVLRVPLIIFFWQIFCCRCVSC